MQVQGVQLTQDVRHRGWSLASVTGVCTRWHALHKASMGALLLLLPQGDREPPGMKTKEII